VWGEFRRARASEFSIGIFFEKSSNFIQKRPQKETSESERWEEARAEGAGVGKRARRSATNWDGIGRAKWADLSLVSYLKAI